MSYSEGRRSCRTQASAGTFHRDRDNNLPDGARIVGVSRTARTDDDYREFARKALQAHVAPADLSGNVLERFLSRLSYISVDATGANGWKELKAFLEKGALIGSAPSISRSLRLFSGPLPPSSSL